MKCLTLGLTSLGIAFAAHAVERDPVSTTFTFSYQQLQTEEGARQVLERLTDTLRDACQVRHRTHLRYVTGVDKDCVAEMMEDALTQIDSPTLTKIYLAQKR